MLHELYLNYYKGYRAVWMLNLTEEAIFAKIHELIELEYMPK